MVDTGRYDIRGLFRWVLKYLSDHPHVIDDLRERRTKVEAVGSFAEACVLETLRLDQAEALGRDVTNDFVFEGFLIPKGSALRVALRESHRDAQTFPAPDEYRPCRFATRKYGPDAYAPFGIGEHRCIAGNHVVRLATWLVEELVDGFDWTVADDGPRHRGLYHWEPSPLFSLRLWARSA
jgi:cytochrome P450